MPYKDPIKRCEKDGVYRERNRQRIRDRSNSPRYKAMRRAWEDRNRPAQQAWERAYRRQRRKSWLGGKTCCDICQQIPKRRLISDHDHEIAGLYCSHNRNLSCKKCRRGALCDECNTGLGKFYENLKILGNGRAGRYVRKWKKI